MNWIVKARTLLRGALAGVLVAGAPAFAAEEAKKSAELPEWVQVQSTIAALRGKINSQKTSIDGLIKAKQKEKDPKKLLEIVNTLTKEHKDHRKTIEEYNKEINLLKYRFPEVGLKGKEKYERMQLKSLEDMETEMTLEGQINKAVGKMRSQYGTEKAPSPEAKAPPKESTPPSATMESPTPIEPPIMAR